jgi:lipopolysaccharide transport system ATP-binding protein
VLDGGYIVDEGEPRAVVNKFRDRLFGRTRKALANDETPDSDETSLDDPEGDERVSEPAVPAIDFDLSDSDVFNTRPLYQNIEHRWGGGGARITDYALRAADRLYPTSVEVGEQLTIAFRVLFDRPPAFAVFGLMIKTLEGQIVYGTNSELKGKGIDEVAAREAVNCQFSFPVRLNAGHYLISLGVSEASLDGQDLPLDRRYDAILLNVTSAESFLGLFDFSASCTLEK